MGVKLLSFDIDDTILPGRNNADVFRKTWKNLSFKQRPLLCYNTGRLPDDTLRLIKNKILPEPDYMICGVGTSIYDYDDRRIIKEFNQILQEGWNREKVSQVIASLNYNIEPQPEYFQNNFKSSWFFSEAKESEIKAIRKELKKEKLDVNVIYSSSLHLDILPKLANKGNSLEWLLEFLAIDPEHVIVAGNSGNDSAMFKIDNIKGIVVGNAQPELISETKNTQSYYASKKYVEGVFEGLDHFGLDYEVNETDDSEETINLHQVNLMEVKNVKSITEGELDTILEGYEKAKEAIKKNITPMGFSACSLEDNDTNGTDVNYRSVWARDGSITVCGTIPLMDDPEIYKCQKNTLETLIQHISPAGQVPANVRIDSKLPDYSGVGGICSIDGGLWLMIAFHDFVKASGDVDFLRKHIHDLGRMMNWLTAQDGNNDALLEIPEAGDWTDLFGRSYNVLYDEILWYRVNICFGRLLELVGENDRAGDYLRWSQVIKETINFHFWPTTSPSANEHRGFDEQQFSLGDARYLIAQVTPFDFNWRCDIYGNVLAYLYDVVDKEKATTTFRFIWGAGVNEPFPVKNVYPAVNAGDPDWRPYYTVNLLNLPNHYHNGGIWPFVGGAWVRCITKLGLREIALQELHKLAKVNKLGIFHEWEFNEWCHGVTGRPMGKAFQAWSAAEYIAACHSLHLID